MHRAGRLQGVGSGASFLQPASVVIAASRPYGLPPDEGAARPVMRAERGAVLDWLDGGLRAGRRGALAAEYPTLLDPNRPASRRIVRIDGKPAAHAAACVRIARVDGASIPLGLIGLVYTEPRFRRRGLAAACVEACVADLRAAGAAAAFLWSDLHEFYARMGFAPVGREHLVRLDPALLGAPTSGLEPSVGPVQPGDWPRLERLLAQHRAYAEREPGDLARLAAAPACELLVARRDARPVAYAACGRGDDFPGVVHEWAGEPAGVRACLRAFARSGERFALAGPRLEEPLTSLREAGAPVFPGMLALGRLLDPERLFRSAAGDAGESGETRVGGSAAAPWLAHGEARVSLEPAELLRFTLGPDVPERVRALVSDAALARLGLPRPAFLWGFDSI